MAYEIRIYSILSLAKNSGLSVLSCSSTSSLSLAIKQNVYFQFVPYLWWVWKLIDQSSFIVNFLNDELLSCMPTIKKKKFHRMYEKMVSIKSYFRWSLCCRQLCEWISHQVALIAMQLLNGGVNIQISCNPQQSICVIPMEFGWESFHACFVHVCHPSYAVVYFLTHLSLMAGRPTHAETAHYTALASSFIRWLLLWWW